MSLALAIALAIGNRLANWSPSVAINRGTQEIQPTLPFGFISRKPTREAAE